MSEPELVARPPGCSPDLSLLDHVASAVTWKTTKENGRGKENEFGDMLIDLEKQVKNRDDL